MTFIGEVPCCDVVLDVKSAGYPLINTCAAGRYNGVLTTPPKLCSQVRTINKFRCEFVSCLERAVSVPVNKDLRPCLMVDSARRAFGGLDEYVETTFQIPSHSEGKVRTIALKVGTFTGFGHKADSFYLRRSLGARRGNG